LLLKNKYFFNTEITEKAALGLLFLFLNKRFLLFSIGVFGYSKRSFMDKPL